MKIAVLAPVPALILTLGWAAAAPAAEVDRSKLPPEPEGFALEGDPQAGAEVYRKSCGVCHGPEGEGDGRVRSKPPPRDLTDPEALKTSTDWELYQVIKSGGRVLGLAPSMLAWDDMLEEEEIRDVAAYVRSLSEE
ncbi:MAG: c-type cytochrome [Thermoanaerobaculia bacterium]